MPRPFLSFIFALATATLVLLGAGPALSLADPVAPATPSPKAQQKQYPEVQEALQHLAKRDMAGALKILEGVSRKNAELPSGHVLMYQILAQLNQPNVARFELERAIHEAPSDPEPYVILGNIALQDRRVAEATMDFDKAKQLLASYTNAKRKAAMEQQTLSGIAQVAEAGENWKDAEVRLRDLLKIAPDDLLAHQRLARALFWQGKAQESYDMLKAAKAIDRENAKKNKTKEVFLTPEAIMARYYYEYEGAKSPNPEKWYKAALKTAPKDLATRQVVAIWALEAGKLDFAKEQADAALKIEESDPTLYSGSNVGNMLCGLVALWEKKWPDAENYFQKVILEDPTNLGARNNIALALVEQDDPAKKQRALRYAEENYSGSNGANKNNPEILSTLGWVYFRRNEFDQARLTLDQAVKASNGNVSNPDTATYVAYVLYHQDQKWPAKEILENILKSERPFSMRLEAQNLYEKVKDTPKPADTSAAGAAVPKTP